MIEEKICPQCGEPYEGSLMQHLMKTRHDITIKQLEDLRARLAEAEESVRKANVTIEYQSNRFKKYEKRTHEAEEEIKSLKVQRHIDSDHRAMYCQMKNEAEAKIRVASELVQKAMFLMDGSNRPDKFSLRLCVFVPGSGYTNSSLKEDEDLRDVLKELEAALHRKTEEYRNQDGADRPPKVCPKSPNGIHIRYSHQKL